MDKATLLKNLLAGKVPNQNVTIKEGKIDESPKVEIKEEADEIYVYRKQLKKIHTYEKILKEDAENWTEDNWKSFKEWLNPSNVTDLLADVFEKKNEIQEEQLNERTKIRQEALKNIDLSKMDLLLR